MEIFEVGQEFEGAYPPEAAAWCNANGGAIEELAAAVAELGDLLAAQEAANAEVLAALAEIGDAVAARAGEE